MRFFIPLSKWIVATLFLAALVSCGSAEQKETTARQDTTAVAPPHHTDTSLANTIDTDTTAYETAYLVIADTGQNYYRLRDKMLAISMAMKWPVDTMDRYYNTKKKEIVLPDDHEDELYRGEYFPRRYASETLSLEYYRSYHDSSTIKNIALMAAICAAESVADSFCTLLRPQAPAAFVLKTRIYIGCIH